MAFNAFKYVDELRDAGIPDKQAEAHLRVLSSIIEGELATKHDIELLRKDMKESENNLKRDIKELELKINESQKHQSQQIAASQDRQTLKIILSMAGVMAGLLALFGFAASMFKAAS